MLKNSFLIFIVVSAILLAVVSAKAQDCTPWGCGCPGGEDWWEGVCQVMPPEPVAHPNIYFPTIMREN